MSRRVIGDFEIETALGRGCLGEAFLARHKSLGSKFVIKLPPDPNYILKLKEGFWRGVNIAHPQVVAFTAAGIEADQAWIAFPYASARSISAIARKQKVPDVEATCCTIKIVLSILEQIRWQDLAHGCLTPNNLIVDEKRKLVITDFGLGPFVSQLDPVAYREHLDRPLWDGGPKSGSFIAPSVRAGGPQSPEKDLYSVGVLFFFLLMTCRTDIDRSFGVSLHPRVPLEIGQIILDLISERSISAGEAALDVDSLKLDALTYPALPVEPVKPRENRSERTALKKIAIQGTRRIPDFILGPATEATPRSPIPADQKPSLPAPAPEAEAPLSGLSSLARRAARSAAAKAASVEPVAALDSPAPHKETNASLDDDAAAWPQQASLWGWGNKKDKASTPPPVTPTERRPSPLESDEAEAPEKRDSYANYKEWGRTILPSWGDDD